MTASGQLEVDADVDVGQEATREGIAPEEVRRARAYLLRVAEPPAAALSMLIAHVGPVEAAARVAGAAVPPAVAQETEARRRDDGRAAYDRAIAKGDRLVVPEDDEWPDWPLHALTVAGERDVPGMVCPTALWVRGKGRLDQAVNRAVTLVGSRASTRYGEFVASDWAYNLAAEGVTVFSGAAYGIDGAGHRGALAAEGVTMAVLGCALDVGYPAGHDLLLRKIADHGLVISEYPHGARPARHRFLVRNRLLAALSAGTVVVEADVRSGARNTANTASILGRAVMAVPGSLTSRSSAGVHAMIRSGQAELVTSAADVLEAVGELGSDLAPEREKPKRPVDELTGLALRVHEALQPRAGKSAEQLAAESGVPLAKVRAVLPELELDGFSERCEAGWRRGKGGDRPNERSARNVW